MASHILLRRYLKARDGAEQPGLLSLHLAVAPDDHLGASGQLALVGRSRRAEDSHDAPLGQEEAEGRHLAAIEDAERSLGAHQEDVMPVGHTLVMEEQQRGVGAEPGLLA
jgi:hypothetical protein